MNIGIDIDGVLADDDTYTLDNMTKYCYLNNLPRLEKPYGYENRKGDWSDEVKEDYRNKYFFEYIKNVKARSYAADITKKLHDDGNRIVIITARYKTTEDSKIGEQMRTDTKNWLDKNNIYYDDICFANCPKTTEILDNKIDLMIDDSPEILPEIVKETKTLCFDNRYNRDLELDNMIRVFSWYDIYIVIQELLNGKL